VEQFKARQVKRIYEAIVHGVLAHDSGTIDAPIGRDPANRLRMSVQDKGKQAITQFETMKRYQDFTYVACELLTGRMHQIRVHMKYINHPIVGDQIYNDQKTLPINGQ